MGFSASEKATYGLLPGDILLNEGQSLELVGRSAIYDGPPGAYCFQNTLVRFRSGPEVLPEYAQIVFSRWLATGVFASIAKKTTSIAHLGGNRFAALRFPSLPLAEQQRIVEVVTVITTQHQAAKRAISKLRIIQQSTIDALHEHPTLRNEFETLGSRLQRIEAGHSPDLPNRRRRTGRLGVLKVSAVHATGFRPSENKAIDDTSLVDERYLVREGDLLVSRANTPELVGSSCIATATLSNLLLSDKTLRLIEDKSFADRRFIHLFLSSNTARRQITNAASGSSRSMQNISQKAIAGLMLKWPSLFTQRRFVAQIRAFDDLVRHEESKLAKFESDRTRNSS